MTAESISSSDDDRCSSQEPIDWDEDHQKATQGVKPNAKYGAISESLRHAIPGPTTCSLFCGGKKCKYCNPEPWKKDQQAIEGLFSNWVTDNILATARPSTTIMNKYDVIGQFKKKGISSIVCLQLPGEHSSCGHGLEDLGFSYNPQDFMDNDVFFYNFGWQDYGVGSLTNILDMVKVMQFALSEGKVAVHCHAGLGRTGVLIACYLIFANRMSADDVVHYIRLKRPGSVQTRSQIECIQGFAHFLKPLQVVFSTVAEDAYDFTLAQYLTRQRHMLHGFEARDLKYIPKVVHVCCHRLLEIATRRRASASKRDSIDIIKKTASHAFNNSSHDKVCPTPNSLSATPLTHDPNAPASSLSLSKSHSLESFTAVNYSRHKSRLSAVSHSSSLQSASEADSDSDSRFGMPMSSQGSQSDLRKKLLNMDIRNSREFRVETPVARVVEAMAETEYSIDVRRRVEGYKVDLNENTDAWQSLSREKDPEVVAALMWDWLDHLKEPILHAQDMPQMLEYVENPMAGLAQLGKGAQQTLLYLFQTMAYLEPLPEDIELNIIQRLLSTLTHQNMVMEVGLLLSPEREQIRRTANDTGLMRDNVANKLMYFFAHLLHLLCQRISSGGKEEPEKEMETRTSRSQDKVGRAPRTKGKKKT